MSCARCSAYLKQRRMRLSPQKRHRCLPEFTDPTPICGLTRYASRRIVDFVSSLCHARRKQVCLPTLRKRHGGTIRSTSHQGPYRFPRSTTAALQPHRCTATSRRAYAASSSRCAGSLPPFSKLLGCFKTSEDEAVRLVTRLVQEGFLRQTPDGRFRLPS